MLEARAALLDWDVSMHECKEAVLSAQPRPAAGGVAKDGSPAPPTLGRADFSGFTFSAVVPHQANQWRDLEFLASDEFQPHQLLLSRAPITADLPGGLTECWEDANKVVASLRANKVVASLRHESPEHVRLVYLVKVLPTPLLAVDL
eukprot:3439540-Rhodomonas_salina.1